MPSHERPSPLAVKVAIQAVALAVGLAILLLVDHLTGWVGLVS